MHHKPKEERKIFTHGGLTYQYEYALEDLKIFWVKDSSGKIIDPEDCDGDQEIVTEAWNDFEEMIRSEIDFNRGAL